MKTNGWKKTLLGTGTVFLLGLSTLPAYAEHTAEHATESAKTAYPADNTGKNTRDRNDRTLTPENQSNNEVDVKLTQNVRKSLSADDSLSVNAKNIKIISVNSRVTLRGPVNSTEEKNKVCEKAKEVAGINNVVDELEVISK